MSISRFFSMNFLCLVYSMILRITKDCSSFVSLPIFYLPLCYSLPDFKDISPRLERIGELLFRSC